MKGMLPVPPLARGPQGDFPVHEIQEGKRQSIKEAAQSFESYFIYTLVQEMRRTVSKSDLFPSGPGQEVYTFLLDQALAVRLANAGDLGISRYLMETWSQSY